MLRMHQDLEGKRVKNYEIIKQINSGSFSRVYQAHDTNSSARMAVKSIPIFLVKQRPQIQLLTKSQIKLIRKCNNQNIVGYIDYLTTSNSILLIMELCNGGGLDQYLSRKKRLSQKQATIFLAQILNGFKGLHEVGAMHRDLKLANILLHNGVCKIGDLGFAKQMNSQKLTATMLGTTMTMAPQVLQGKPYGIQADLWSIGVIYYQMIYGQYPYRASSDQQMLKKIKMLRPNYKKVEISDECRNFIQRCLTVDPSKRIKWVGVYLHPLICPNRTCLDQQDKSQPRHDPVQDRQRLSNSERQNQKLKTQVNELNKLLQQKEQFIQRNKKLIIGLNNQIIQKDNTLLTMKNKQQDLREVIARKQEQNKKAHSAIQGIKSQIKKQVFNLKSQISLKDEVIKCEKNKIKQFGKVIASKQGQRERLQSLLEQIQYLVSSSTSFSYIQHIQSCQKPEPNQQPNTTPAITSYKQPQLFTTIMTQTIQFQSPQERYYLLPQRLRKILQLSGKAIPIAEQTYSTSVNTPKECRNQEQQHKSTFFDLIAKAGSFFGGGNDNKQQSVQNGHQIVQGNSPISHSSSQQLHLN